MLWENYTLVTASCPQNVSDVYTSPQDCPGIPCGYYIYPRYSMILGQSCVILSTGVGNTKRECKIDLESFNISQILIWFTKMKLHEILFIMLCCILIIVSLIINVCICHLCIE